MESVPTKKYSLLELRKAPTIKSKRHAPPMYTEIKKINTKPGLDTDAQTTLRKIIMKWFDDNCKPNNDVSVNPFIMSILSDNFGIERNDDTLSIDLFLAKSPFKTKLDEAIEYVFKTPLTFKRKEVKENKLEVPPREDDNDIVNDYFQKPEHEKILLKTKNFWKQENFPVECNYEAGEKFIESIDILKEIIAKWQTYEDCIKKIANELAKILEGYSLLKRNTIVNKKLELTINSYLQRLDLRELCQYMIKDLMIVQYYSPLFLKIQEIQESTNVFKNLDKTFNMNSLMHNVQTIYSRGGPAPAFEVSHHDYALMKQIKTNKINEMAENITNTIITPAKSQSDLSEMTHIWKLLRPWEN